MRKTLFKWLREHTGVRAARAFEQLQCRMPTAQEAILLNIARGQPVVDLNRWVRADDDTLFEYTHIVANGALHEISTKLIDMRPRYIGLFALKGFVEDKNVQPVLFKSISIKGIECP